MIETLDQVNRVQLEESIYASPLACTQSILPILCAKPRMKTVGAHQQRFLGSPRTADTHILQVTKTCRDWECG